MHTYIHTYIPIQYNTMQYNAIQLQIQMRMQIQNASTSTNTIQYNTVQYSTVIHTYILTYIVCIHIYIYIFEQYIYIYIYIYMCVREHLHVANLTVQTTTQRLTRNDWDTPCPKWICLFCICHITNVGRTMNTYNFSISMRGIQGMNVQSNQLF